MFIRGSVGGVGDYFHFGFIIDISCGPVEDLNLRAGEVRIKELLGVEQLYFMGEEGFRRIEGKLYFRSVDRVVVLHFVYFVCVSGFCKYGK